MENKNSDLDTLIQNKVDSDTEFQATLADLADEEKEQVIADKKAELIKAEFTAREDAIKKAEEIAVNQKIRAEKAEQELKTAKGEKTPKNEPMSLQDIRALQDVHDEDVEQVVNYAKFKGITIPEAKKLPEMQSLLKTREEERKTAEATNTGGGRKAPSKNTGADLLQRALEKGELPEEEEDMKKMIEARFTPKEK